MTALLLLAPFAPLFMAALIALGGRWLPDRGGGLALGGIFIAALAMLPLSGTDTEMTLTWFTVGRFALTLSLAADSLGWWMATLVAWIALPVAVYSVSYMADEGGRQRFFAWLSFFVGMMLLLVLSQSLLLLFIAWEGVGLASFALIGQRHGQTKARQAAIKALLMTRLADMGLLLGWLWVLTITGTTQLPLFFAQVENGVFTTGTLNGLALLFFLAAMGKSAQLPLTAWLPEAMAGPTPVSALIHSATMAAAGVFLVLRLFPLFEHTPLALAVVLGVGAFTALIAALVATAQYDLKRLLAWSTVSQLGEMMLALGLGGPLAAAFHLTVHATFKSALFLSAGALERATGTRDLRRLGGLGKRLPWTAGAFLASALALAGFPLLSGYWSGEHLLRQAISVHAAWGIIMLVLTLLAGIYIGRATMATFGVTPRTATPANSRESVALVGPALGLALAAAGLGALIKTPIEAMLPFAASSAALSGAWSQGAVLASLIGLGLGAGRVYQRGPAPALGRWPSRLAVIIYGLVAVTARTAIAGAVTLARLERHVDRSGRFFATGALLLAKGVLLYESFFNGAARASRDTAMAAGEAAARFESAIWGAGHDRLAGFFQWGGQKLRSSQSGKLYLYTLSVFAFIFLIGVGIVAVGLLLAGND
ncbi:NADH-quinone oxidoreductase subunit L [Nitrosococcus watsonii]|uniref:Proton-translocating NADH-quinone oxidoreductase, chain L n=1 Tax=Nitrosococcus watsoni (strain C-113) TaxID=105559 RepID=D8KA45_NITWC|nr:proton-conducting transporter membrane subunit [Nitrosococcus watsonii]ADJ29403.1 proton-translocating NADH-quinone oxidoreductase, chain L [Nitrosococcus watsonii C-113]